MKKILAITMALFCAAGMVFADDVDDYLKQQEVNNKTITIVPKDQHQDGVKTAKVQLEYTPSTHEVHIYYDCLAVSYDQGAAMNTILECLKDFQDQNMQYESYRYMRKDSVKYYNDERKLKWARYHSWVEFKPRTLDDSIKDYIMQQQNKAN
ncbi:MAG: hypothetical protein II684_02830 [Treponema sp.]|nr:hypothetical protein [Treponema sp.]MBR4463100.1 hypothetical protein [Treponema sp.]